MASKQAGGAYWDSTYGGSAEVAEAQPSQEDHDDDHDHDDDNDNDDDDDNDRPVVFVCGKCKLPVGDSLSWAGSDDKSQIHLNHVTENVLVGKETHLYKQSKGYSCLIVHLSCRGCHSLIGMVYKSTPKTLDYKRFRFCMQVENIESYVLGSAKQMVAAETPPQQQPVTLEYREAVELQLSEVKALVVSIAQRLEKIEGCL